MGTAGTETRRTWMWLVPLFGIALLAVVATMRSTGNPGTVSRTTGAAGDGEAPPVDYGDPRVTSYPKRDSAELAQSNFKSMESGAPSTNTQNAPRKQLEDLIHHLGSERIEERQAALNTLRQLTKRQDLTSQEEWLKALSSGQLTMTK